MHVCVFRRAWIGRPLLSADPAHVRVDQHRLTDPTHPHTSNKPTHIPRFNHQAVDFELTKGVAGSRKTQHAVDRAQAAGSSGEAANVLFLVKVGSNAQEIRSRMAGQHGLVFRRHGVTNHFVARSWDGGDEGSDGGGKPRRRGGRRKKGDEGAGAAAAGAAGVFLDGKGKGKGGGASYWVASFDAFVDCQLRVHEAIKEPLRTRGANFEWKVRRGGGGEAVGNVDGMEWHLGTLILNVYMYTNAQRSELLRLVREGKHHGFRLKDGASAGGLHPAIYVRVLPRLYD